MKKTQLIVALLVVLFAESAFVVFLLHQERPAVAQNLASSQLNAIQRENQLPGTTTWQITHPAPTDPRSFRSPAIEGYGWMTSALAGARISFSVSTTAPTYRVDIYRLGWYQGKGGRLLQSIPSLQGHFYAMPRTDAQTGLKEANWPAAFAIKVAPNWVSGIYIAKLTADSGVQYAIPFVIRSNLASDFAFIYAANSAEANNNWGGKSLNDYNSTGQQRAFKVSFDRPFLGDAGLTYILLWEYPMIRWLEKKGYDVSYLSTTDVQDSPALLRNHRGILIVGRNEYWSKQMRDNLEGAVNSGVNLANFAANSIYWQIRYEPSIVKHEAVPDRVIVCYKDPALDPLTGKDNSQVTVRFRDPPVNRPEQFLLGSMLEGEFNWGTSYNWVVADATNWVFAGTTLKNGDALPGLVGYEYDGVSLSSPVPFGDSILSSSPVHNADRNRDELSNATLYSSSSGARVFDVATNRWSWGLDGYGDHNVVNLNAQKITQNVLMNFVDAASIPLS